MKKLRSVKREIQVCGKLTVELLGGDDVSRQLGNTTRRLKSLSPSLMSPTSTGSYNINGDSSLFIFCTDTDTINF